METAGRRGWVRRTASAQRVQAPGCCRPQRQCSPGLPTHLPQHSSVSRDTVCCTWALACSCRDREAGHRQTGRSKGTPYVASCPASHREQKGPTCWMKCCSSGEALCCGAAMARVLRCLVLGWMSPPPVWGGGYLWLPRLGDRIGVAHESACSACRVGPRRDGGGE